ncbi:hypothetical protein HU200_042429 [Digitaria exilis]|uniref:TF-B3 domain-containing protein n=1 Tax=Digitaria exilis TaxID=1010633 RepID=A0A835B2K8_9POAL|nr:hypothetical protein HU200_042429 [Digitaria exilis]
MAKQLKVLLPPSFHKLGCFDDASAISDSGKGVPLGPTALVVSPFGKVWRVEVGRDGDGAFLGRGWPEFLAAHGVGVGWFVVLRHQGGGVLTFKAFDTSFCIKEFAAPAAAMASRSSKRISSKPQFIRITYPDFSEKMIIPARFVKKYITEDCMNRRTAVISSPLGKFWQIELEKNQSGNMVFKFKAFGLSGCQKDFKNQDVHVKTQNNIEMQQESTPPIRKRKSKSSSEENKRQKSSVTSLNRKLSQKKPDYQIGPSCWIRKEISTYALERFLSLPVKFCHSIGFRKACTIMLKTEMDNTRTWQVRGLVYEKVCYLVGVGWRCFCKDNKMKKDDLCTFNIIETTLWHVVITRCKHQSTLANTKRQKESPCSSSKEHKTKKGSSSSKEGMRPKGSVNSFSKASRYTTSVYEIGPPSWIRKEMNNNSITKHLSLAVNFCSAIGLQKRCTITLKTSTNSRSWKVRGLMHKTGSYQIGPGWIKFCRENRLKVGDICTFNVIKTLLWHVVITRH